MAYSMEFMEELYRHEGDALCARLRSEKIRPAQLKQIDARCVRAESRHQGSRLSECESRG